MMPVCLPEKYEILGELGSGGMGLVYHARDRVLDREVALKVMSEQFAANPNFAQRFLTEARAAASLNHPNIVQIYEFGEAGKGHFLAMELVRGHTLKQELKKVGRFSEGQTVGLMLTACRTLAFAHDAGIVHRDVKPDNMMFTDRREFKLVDLGLAKCLYEEISHTMTGQAMGTPHFVSPEQIMGARVIDARADVYSLGATMYNLATGAVPFDGTSGAHIMARHLNDPLPDPRKIAPDLSAGFCRILGRMMAKDPDDRYQDMATVGGELMVVHQGGQPAHSGPVPTAVQETIFLSSPDLAPAATVTWDEDALKKVTRRLAEYIGPLAKILVGKVGAKVSSWEELSEELAGHIRASEDRKAFLKACVRIGEGGGTTSIESSIDDSAAMTMPISGDLPTMPRETTVVPAFSLDEARKDRVVGLLAESIGPVAKVLVQRAVPKVENLDELTSKLARAIPDEAQRHAFISAMDKLV